MKELIPFIKEDIDENDEIKLWDLKEDIGCMDDMDIKIIEIINEES